MSKVFDRLISSLNNRDEQANVLLAEQIAHEQDQDAMVTLMGLLTHKNKALRYDVIKVLYEIGARAPQLISPYDQEFLTLLTDKDNRLQWGAMTALDYLTPLRPEAIYQALPVILDAAQKGSVITRDHAVNILIHLARHENYRADIIPLLLEQLETAPVNQLPMYAEKASAIFNSEGLSTFVELLKRRLIDLEKDSQKKRIEKIIKKCLK